MIEIARFLVVSDEWLPREWMPGVATSVVVVLAVIAALAAILFISSLISILASPRYTGGGKLLWIIGIRLSDRRSARVVARRPQRSDSHRSLVTAAARLS